MNKKAPVDELLQLAESAVRFADPLIPRLDRERVTIELRDRIASVVDVLECAVPDASIRRAILANVRITHDMTEGDIAAAMSRELDKIQRLTGQQ